MEHQHNHDYTVRSTAQNIEDGRTLVTHYPIQGSGSFELIETNHDMAITKEELFKELSGAHQQFTEATRRVFALMMKVQNMPEFPKPTVAEQLGERAAQFTPQELASAQALAERTRASTAATTASTTAVEGLALSTRNMNDAATAAAASAQAAAASATMALETRFIPQMNTQESIDQARAEALKTPIVQAALDNAKLVLRDLMAGAGLPADLLGLVDKVTVADLEKGGVPNVQSAMARAMGQQTAAKAPQPTEVDLEQAQTEQKERNTALSALIGVGSIFADNLSPNVIFHGRGVIEPKYTEDLKRYKQDALWTDEKTLRGYPTGFYLNKDTMVMQFMMNTDQFAIVVDGLPNENAPVHVLTYGANGGFKPVQDFMPSEQRLIHAKLDMAFSALKKNH